MTARRVVEARRDIVEVRDVNGETALCPAEAILQEVDGENQWLLYPAALPGRGDRLEPISKTPGQDGLPTGGAVVMGGDMPTRMFLSKNWWKSSSRGGI